MYANKRAITHLEIKLPSKYYLSIIHIYTHTYIYSNIYIYIYIYIYISLSSSCHAASTDLPDPLSSLVSIVHRSRQVFKSTSYIGTEMLYIVSSWSPCLYSSIWRGPQDYVAHEFVPTSPAVSCMSGSSNFVMGGRWPFSCCFLGCCLKDLFNIARSILV